MDLYTIEQRLGIEQQRGLESARFFCIPNEVNAMISYAKYLGLNELVELFEKQTERISQIYIQNPKFKSQVDGYGVSAGFAEFEQEIKDIVNEYNQLVNRIRSFLPEARRKENLAYHEEMLKAEKEIEDLYAAGYASKFTDRSVIGNSAAKVQITNLMDDGKRMPLYLFRQLPTFWWNELHKSYYLGIYNNDLSAPLIAELRMLGYVEDTVWSGMKNEMRKIYVYTDDKKIYRSLGRHREENYCFRFTQLYIGR